ncbi:hypothetical protein BX666DRAFT_1860740 [Dichotomocladium elegans]|nr:hypothetical protein BX666DRAFT_1860740 [Dichotomocladium elegans]
MIWYMTMAGIVFRFEAGILLAILVGLEWLVYQTLPLKTWLLHGVACAILSLALSVPIDSFFWQRCLWPEGEVFYFNVILNKSSEWGTMPFYAYYVNFLPRLLLIAYPLALISYVTNGRVRRMLLPNLLYINLFSILPHKEWRFIMYTIPIWTIAASSLVASLRSRLKLFLVICGGLGSFAASLLMLYVSIQNYPGGHALRRLHMLEDPAHPVKVHIDVPAAMTGASRFGELFRPRWSYWKTESHMAVDDYLAMEYTHLITSHPELFSDAFEPIDVISGYDGLRFQRPRMTDDYTTLVPFKIDISPKLTIMRLRNPQVTWVQATLRNNPVVLYSKTYCPYCRHAKMILNKYCSDNYTIIEVDLRRDAQEMKQALYEISGRHTFPNVFVDGKSIGGSDDLTKLDTSKQLQNLLPCYEHNR